ncbi:MAG: hypothetical protein J7L50_03290 [Candidatus Odinarchaeota archaeon]|nr:hypothetical protein [Candidatus Odinarchaeota archaeon]
MYSVVQHLLEIVEDFNNIKMRDTQKALEENFIEIPINDYRKIHEKIVVLLRVMVNSGVNLDSAVEKSVKELGDYLNSLDSIVNLMDLIKIFESFRTIMKDFSSLLLNREDYLERITKMKVDASLDLSEELLLILHKLIKEKEQLELDIIEFKKGITELMEENRKLNESLSAIYSSDDVSSKMKKMYNEMLKENRKLKTRIDYLKEIISEKNREIERLKSIKMDLKQGKKGAIEGDLVKKEELINLKRKYSLLIKKLIEERDSWKERATERSIRNIFYYLKTVQERLKELSSENTRLKKEIERLQRSRP